MDEILEDDTGAAEPQIVYQDRVIEVPVEVQITRPVATDEQGVTWVGNIGMSPMGLLMPEEVTQQEWYDFFDVIRNVKRSWQFIIGDWFAYGKDVFGYTYEQIATWTGYSSNSVEAFASTCRNVPRFTRVNLSFAHHRAVAVLPPEKQVLALQEAIDNKWSSRDLKTAISGSKKRLKSGSKTKKSLPKVVNRKLFNQAKQADVETKKLIAAELRRMAEELER